jgi:hypothetical protein
MHENGMNSEGSGASGEAEAAPRVPDRDQVMPVPPQEVVEAAKAAPDHWFAMIDPAWSDPEQAPHWAMVGQWRSNDVGEIVEWSGNDEYRPSPAALRWPEPTDPVDSAVQLAATGYGPAEDVTHALRIAELAVLVRPDGALVTAGTEQGEPVVPAFTAQAHLAWAGRLAFEVLPIARLLERLPVGHELYLNPAGPVAFRVADVHLREVIGPTA